MYADDTSLTLSAYDSTTLEEKLNKDLEEVQKWLKSNKLTPGGRVGLVVRALAFHQCGPGSISALGVIRGFSLLVLYSAMGGFPPGTPVFPSHQKPTFDLI